MIGGEGEASPKWMAKGMWIEWGKKYNALCFQLEHRFYGKSHPTRYANSIFKAICMYIPLQSYYFSVP